MASFVLGWTTLVGASSLGLIGCDGAACVEGQTTTCACDDGRMGAQTCGASGTYGPCFCDGDTMDGGPPDDDTMDGGPPAGGDGGTTSETTLGPEGGVLDAGCVTLTVPPGALASETTFAVEHVDDVSAIPGFVLHSDLFRVNPPDLELAAPIEVSMCTDTTESVSVFLSAAGLDGYDRLPSSIVDGRVIAELDHLGEIFVGDSRNYVLPVDPTCVQSELLEARTTEPSAVGLFLTIDDCEGRPIVGLRAEDFLIEEGEIVSETMPVDFNPVSVEAATTILPSELTVFITLLLDFSGSTAAFVDKIIEAAQGFVRQVQVDRGVEAYIGVSLFDGVSDVTEWVRWTRDSDLLLTRLGELSTYAPTDPGSTNLHGALNAAVPALDRVRQDFRTRNLDGSFTNGYTVLFTDGRDTAGLVDTGTVEATIDVADSRVVAVGLDSPDYDLAALESLATGQVITATSAEALDAQFGELANIIAGQVERTYLLGYCSARRTGEQRVRTSVQGATDTSSITFDFSADGFGPGCGAAFFESVCDGIECGGFVCGACGYEHSQCAGGECRNYCDLPVGDSVCGDRTFTNPAGYQQSCPDVPPEHVDCGGVCVNQHTSEMHCGACDNPCPGGVTCTSGGCGTCPSGQTVCDDACHDLQTDEAHCGSCGTSCSSTFASASVCVGGACSCPGVDGRVCSGTCRDVDSDFGNCGSCGNRCTVSGQSCVSGSCVCPSGHIVCGGTCVDARNDEANCGTCGNACSGATPNCNSGTCALCPTGWEEYAGHCYRALAHSDGDGVFADAAAVGAYVITIDDAAEEEFMRTNWGGGYIGLRGISPSPCGCGAGCPLCTSYGWSNGDPVTYTNWCSGQPGGTNRVWYDGACWRTQPDYYVGWGVAEMEP